MLVHVFRRTAPQSWCSHLPEGWFRVFTFQTLPCAQNRRSLISSMFVPPTYIFATLFSLTLLGIYQEWLLHQNSLSSFSFLLPWILGFFVEKKFGFSGRCKHLWSLSVYSHKNKFELDVFLPISLPIIQFWVLLNITSEAWGMIGIDFVFPQMESPKALLLAAIAYGGRYLQQLGDRIL